MENHELISEKEKNETTLTTARLIYCIFFNQRMHCKLSLWIFIANWAYGYPLGKTKHQSTNSETGAACGWTCLPCHIMSYQIKMDMLKFMCLVEF